MFLEFDEDLNTAEGSSSLGDNSGDVSSLDSWSWRVRYLRWDNVGRKYIEIIKGDLQRQFVLDFNDQVMNRFVEHQILTSFKEFRGDCYKHFKKYSDPEQVAEDVHGSQPLSRDEICETILDRQSSYSKGLGWGPKPKSRKTASISSSSTTFLQAREYKLQEVKLSSNESKFNEAKQAIEEQRMISEMLTS
ncbi:CACTA en-spm transposon protein [Cucumis melo var. makuwa]|uniref:CACTA en-spm transposon protein n=1 Tax=Cucumis melo var. makuwa TaxID=1194695 RepID=A0A5D3DHM7_CUCMM|nr:CACTA en-spm transposon protein [Cucumis melo var. makuwa]TYK23083.1 CACTA en-spm transposon protein [Cucumis melo var. makuwa]